VVDVIPATTFAAELRTARIARDQLEADDKGGPWSRRRSRFSRSSTRWSQLPNAHCRWAST
jgi:hypothetical protein